MSLGGVGAGVGRDKKNKFTVVDLADRGWGGEVVSIQRFLCRKKRKM